MLILRAQVGTSKPYILRVSLGAPGGNLVLMICSSISDPSELQKYRRFPRKVFREVDTMKARACDEQLAPSVR